MRRIIFGCILTLCYTAVFAQMKTDLALLNLKGPVKKWEMKLIDPKDSSILEHKITFFNPRGFKTKEETLGNFAQIQNFVYDEKGRLIKSFIEGDNNAIEYLYRTNSDGSLTVIHKYKAKGMPDRIVSENTYDKNGLLIIEKTEDESCEEGCEKLENSMNKYSHHYDEQGNLVEIKNEIFDNESIKFTNKYVDGKLVEQTETSYGSKEVRTFDANGHLIKLEDFPPHGFGDGSSSSIKVWKNTVDNYGNVLKIETFDESNNSSSTIVENSYEYY